MGAVLTSLSLLSAFKDKADIDDIDLSDAYVMAGVIFGAMLPFLFAALTMLSVQKAAGAIIIEVRRQFAEIEGLWEGTAEPDSDKCVAISTQSSVEEMILPGLCNDVSSDYWINDRTKMSCWNACRSYCIGYDARAHDVKCRRCMGQLKEIH